MLIEILEDDGLVDGQLCIDDRIETASSSAEAVDDSLGEGTCGISQLGAAHARDLFDK